MALKYITMSESVVARKSAEIAAVRVSIDSVRVSTHILRIVENLWRILKLTVLLEAALKTVVSMAQSSKRLRIVNNLRVRIAVRLVVLHLPAITDSVAIVKLARIHLRTMSKCVEITLL